MWIGLSLGNVGQQLAVLAISLQVYALTRSSFAVGLVGLCGLVPLIVLGLYGGSIVDAHDRRRVALIASVFLWLVSTATALQAWLNLDSVMLLYVLVALQSAGFAVNSTARQAIVPGLVRREKLAAANALDSLSWNLGFTLGPTLAGLLVGGYGFRAAYSVDVLTYFAALWAIWRLPPLLPEGVVRRAGLRSVAEGLRFVTTRPNVRMSFLVDICAMVLAQPRALFPAIGAVVLGGGPATVGVLASAVAVGAVAAGLISGRLGSVRRQGLAVLVSVVAWAVSITGFGVFVLLAAHSGPPTTSATSGGSGVSSLVWPAAACLVAAGACDSVSSVFRSTILQSATPDALRGRLQGVFIVVVAGGPRLGDLVSGSSGDLLGEGAAVVLGGVLCAVAVIGLARRQRGFARYDAEHPSP